jgi:hypothetical protein
MMSQTNLTVSIYMMTIISAKTERSILKTQHCQIIFKYTADKQGTFVTAFIPTHAHKYTLKH